MNAFIFSFTTSQPLMAPIDAPTTRAIASETGTTSHSGVSVRPMPMPREQNRMPVTIAVSAATEFDGQIHVAGDDDEREPDRHHAEHRSSASMMLAKMPI